MKNLKVVELFAGVGGFRLGLTNVSEKFDFVLSNQWEPGRKIQHAFNCYVTNFNKECAINDNISIVKKGIPPHDLLVGGFPCQDYSVAATGSQGIEGKKGILWWEIHDIVNAHKPKYILLENVDRLLKSPSKSRGRDFSIMLKVLTDLGYFIEWRVINAADYGFAQRRRRVFIFAYRKDTNFGKRVSKLLKKNRNPLKYSSFFNEKFRIEEIGDVLKQDIFSGVTSEKEDLNNLTNNYLNSGISFNDQIIQVNVVPIKVENQTLRDIIEIDVDDKYYLTQEQIEKFKKLKGAKKEPRVSKLGIRYFYSEGAISFPDNLDKPGRTMLTSEASINRSTHVIEDPKTKRFRFLTEIECERLNGFPDNWTNKGMPSKSRYFCMGNALVVPLISIMGERILEIDKFDIKFMFHCFIETANLFMNNSYFNGSLYDKQ